jgi:tetratricopeptide (TPR) repeat protein
MTYPTLNVNRFRFIAFFLLSVAFLISTTPLRAQDNDIPITTKSSEAKAQFKQAKHAWDMGRDEDARKSIDMALKADPNFTMGYYLKAVMATNPADWRQNLDKAMDMTGNVSEGEKMLINIEHSYATNDLGKRMKLSKQLLQLYPNSSWAMLKAADVYAGEKQYNKERDLYYRAMQVEPKKSITYRKLAESYQFQEPKDLDLAETYMTKFVNMEPNEVFAHIALGDVYRAQNNLMKARDTYSKAIKLDGQEAVAYSKRGHANSFLGNYQQARDDFDQAIKVSPAKDWATHESFIGNTYIYSGELDRAQEYFQKIVQEVNQWNLSPDNETVAAMMSNENLFYVTLANRDFDRARSTLDQLNTLYSTLYNDIGSSSAMRDDQAARAIREGLLALRQGYVEQAMNHARENYNLMRDDPSVKALYPYYHLMGRIELQQNNPENAVRNLEMADTEWVIVKYDLAMAYDALGNTDMARKMYKDVAEWNFNDTRYALVRNVAINKYKTMAVLR